MEKLILHWQLGEQPEEAGTERYCHNCGRKVLFQDSGKRRNNANGKNIYEYAIYKCGNGHTWNQILSIQKAKETVRSMDVEVGQELCTHVEFPKQSEPLEEMNLTDGFGANYENELIDIAKLKQDGNRAVEITLDNVTGKWRLDKALSRQIPDLSRTQLEKRIKDGAIRLDGKIVKPGCLLKPLQVITISL